MDRWSKWRSAAICELSERWSGKTVALERGSVMVEAAKQRRGRLEISTPDCMVSVKGTIFSVSRGLKGSRVSVVEGEVKVDKAGGTELLHRGDQTATNPTMALTSVGRGYCVEREFCEISGAAGRDVGDFEEARCDSGAGDAVQLEADGGVAGEYGGFCFDAESFVDAGGGQFDFRGAGEAESCAGGVVGCGGGAECAEDRGAQVRTVSDYLGDEVVLAVPVVGGKLEKPVMVAEAAEGGVEGVFERLSADGHVVGRGGVGWDGRGAGWT